MDLLAILLAEDVFAGIFHPLARRLSDRPVPWKKCFPVGSGIASNRHLPFFPPYPVLLTIFSYRSLALATTTGFAFRKVFSLFPPVLVPEMVPHLSSI